MPKRTIEQIDASIKRNTRRLAYVELYAPLVLSALPFLLIIVFVIAILTAEANP